MISNGWNLARRVSDDSHYPSRPGAGHRLACGGAVIGLCCPRGWTKKVTVVHLWVALRLAADECKVPLANFFPSVNSDRSNNIQHEHLFGLDKARFTLATSPHGKSRYAQPSTFMGEERAKRHASAAKQKLCEDKISRNLRCERPATCPVAPS